MRRRWYLIQVDIEPTLELNPDFASNHFYWCVFLARHPSDHKKSDKLYWWCPAWYRYTTCEETNEITYGKRVLIRTNNIPCSTNFFQWATLLPLRGKDTITLVGPFSFEIITESNRVCQRVHMSNWYLLIEACNLFGISPPSLRILQPTSHTAKKIKC